MPNFMLVAVVKDEPVALLPRSNLVSDSDECFLRDLQAQMATNSTVGRAAMAEDMCARVQHAELHLTSLACRGCGERFYHFARYRCELAIFSFGSSCEELQLLPVTGVFEILSLVSEATILGKKLETFVSNYLPVLLDFHQVVFVSGLHFRPERRGFQSVHVVEGSLVFGKEQTEVGAFLVNLKTLKIS